MDKLHTDHPTMGSRMLCDSLRLRGYEVNRKRIQRLMRLMGIEAIYPAKSLSKRALGHTVYPYLLRGTTPSHFGHIWSTDITYVPLYKGFLYLTAIIDWYTRLVLSWEISNTLANDFCIEALVAAIKKYGNPNIFNTDQGSQFTAESFTSELNSRGIAISMDGKGRATDNAITERLWRTVKYEDIYIHNYGNGNQLHDGLNKYFRFYNRKRPHSSLDGLTPYEVYQSCA